MEWCDIIWCDIEIYWKPSLSSHLTVSIHEWFFPKLIINYILLYLLIYHHFRFQKERCERLETTLNELKLEVQLLYCTVLYYTALFFSVILFSCVYSCYLFFFSFVLFSFLLFFFVFFCYPSFCFLLFSFLWFSFLFFCFPSRLL